jgi:magnesium chelatase family protein
MDAAMTREFCRPTPQAMVTLERIFEKFNFSARGYDKVLRVARTIADLNGSEIIEEEHIILASQYRSLDRKLWGTK